MMVVIFLALACCMGGVMATVYVIRKTRKQRRAGRKVFVKTPGAPPIYRPVQVMVVPQQTV